MTNKEEFRETVAASCHEQWSGWMKYMFNLSRFNSLGDTLIPMEFASRWQRQMTMAYENLSENEKDSDRIEADKFIRLFGDNAAITEIAALTDVRYAIGVDDKTMLYELPEIARKVKRNADRYEKLVMMTPTEFAVLHGRALREMRPLNELIDAWPEKSPLSADKQ